MARTKALWPELSPLPRMRCVPSVHAGRLSTPSGEVLSLADLLRFVESHGQTPAEIDVGMPRLNDIYRRPDFGAYEEQLFSRNRDVEVALEVTDATVMLAHLLLRLAVQRCHGAVHNSEVILRLLYPGPLRRWSFAKRPDIELGVRIPPLLGLTSRSWLEWALRQVYEDVFVTLSEAPAAIPNHVSERLGGIGRQTSGRPLQWAAPAIVGTYQLTQPQLDVAIGPLANSIADKLGFVIDGDCPSTKEEKDLRCAQVLLQEYLQPQIQIHVEFFWLP